VKLSDLGEHGLIRRVTGGIPLDPARVVLGVGDDCSVTRLPGGQLQLVTTDLLLENVHFLRDVIQPEELGAKAMAVNLSDIAAMGGTALDAWVSLGLSQAVDVEWVDRLYSGMTRVAAAHRVSLLGGDTTAAEQIVLNLVLLGEVAPGEILLRSGAQPGDRIFVSGHLGDSAAGLHALRERLEAPELVRRHHSPEPRLELGRRLATSGLVHAAIDLSDGLASDLNHICDASGVGSEVHADQLPRSAALEAYCRRHHLDPVAFALAGGEDYELLVTGALALRDIPGLVEVGEVVGGDERTLLCGDTRCPLEPAGFDHLR
jgi:thiamine-monophosphate kinase